MSYRIRKTFYSTVPEPVLALGPHCYIVYGFLDRRADKDDGKCWPKQASIAEAVGLSVSSVARALKVLEAEGWIEVQAQYRSSDGGRMANAYWVFGDQKHLIDAQPGAEVRASSRIINDQGEHVDPNVTSDSCPPVRKKGGISQKRRSPSVSKTGASVSGTAHEQEPLVDSHSKESQGNTSADAEQGAPSSSNLPAVTNHGAIESTTQTPRALAEDVVNKWWKWYQDNHGAQPTVAGKWIAVVKMIETLLTSGWSERHVKLALANTPTPSLASLTLACQRVGGTANKPSPTSNTTYSEVDEAVERVRRAREARNSARVVASEPPGDFIDADSWDAT